MLRVYVREIPGLSAARQRALAVAAGVPDKDTAPIYTETRTSFPAERQAVFESFRKPGDELGIARLIVLAKDRNDLRAVMTGLAQNGVVVRELMTGRRSDDPGHNTDMVLDAVNFWSSRGRNFVDPEAAAAAGSKGGKALAARRRKMRMSRNLAIEIWRDKSLSGEEALAKLNADRLTRCGGLPRRPHLSQASST
jgi:hypothetical protein